MDKVKYFPFYPFFSFLFFLILFLFSLLLSVTHGFSEESPHLNLLLVPILHKLVTILVVEEKKEGLAVGRAGPERLIVGRASPEGCWIKEYQLGHGETLSSVHDKC